MPTTHGNLPTLSAIMRKIGETRPHHQLVDIRHKVLSVYRQYPDANLSALAMVALEYVERGKSTTHIVNRPPKQWYRKSKTYA